MSIEMMKNICHEEGRKEKGRASALFMLKEKLSEALVAKCDGLTPEEVHALAGTR